MNIKNLVIGAAMAIAASAGFAASANAAFVLANSNGGDGFANAIPGGFDLFGADNGVGFNSTTLTDTAAVAETLSFKYVYTTNDCCGSVWDPAGYFINGVQTQLSIDGFNGGQFNSSGLVSLALNAGDSYGFYVNSADSVLGRGEIAFSPGVPEPAMWAMMLVGFGAIGLTLRGGKKTGLAAA